MSDRELIGYAYVAKRPCGRISAMCWDDPGHEKDTSKHVASYIKRGDQVERIARYRDDEMPEWICKIGCNNCRAA